MYGLSFTQIQKLNKSKNSRISRELLFCETKFMILKKKNKIVKSYVYHSFFFFFQLKLNVLQLIKPPIRTQLAQQTM